MPLNKGTNPNQLKKTVRVMGFVHGFVTAILFCYQNIDFIFESFLILAMSSLFSVQSLQFVAWSIHIVVFLPIFVF